MPDKGPLPAKASRPRATQRSLQARAGAGTPHGFSVVAVGASAGGLEACRKLLEALPPATGMAFILVQHLDPTHESMMVELLAGSTTMTVRQAVDGMAIAPDHVYVIPPGSYLAVANGALRLSQPLTRHGARLPFDFLLRSLAVECGARTVAVVLSGTGADGSLGAKSIKAAAGLVIAQDPSEAGYDGMPRSAIMTGAVDLVLPIAKIPGALVTFDRRMAVARVPKAARPPAAMQSLLPDIIDLLRTRTTHDFTFYKDGTLQRRIERRMAMASIAADGMDRYLDLLRNDEAELERLGRDLLINVTSFFRDAEVFDFLAEHIVPGLVRGRPADQTIRIWVAGCSTGEETYSLAMLFLAEIAAAKSKTKLQIFASDVDPDAIARAREGLYPETIAADVSPARLAEFFTQEDHAYRVSPELRATVVFTVQDVVSDPPFSRLDMVSCRNLLIYLRPEAQAKIISLFHFALRKDGILVLGNAETIGNAADRFEQVMKSARVYRHIGRVLRAAPSQVSSDSDGGRPTARPGRAQLPSRQSALADLCRRLVLDSYAPAAVLINQKYECLYFLGPTNRYLQVAPGQPTHDLFAMLPQVMRSKLRSAIQQACQTNARIVVDGGRLERDGGLRPYGIDVRPVPSDGDTLLLICFVDGAQVEQTRDDAISPHDRQPVAKLKRELEATRTELKAAIRDLESSAEEQKIINDEALSLNEELQSTNEEHLASKEELQSLNEELSALNAQLQETLERQRTTSNDLQNILYSTDVATVFLDRNLNIRFFTPATKSLFNIIPGDVGRPLADLSSLTADGSLLADAASVLETLSPREREIEARSGAWYVRRISPYRATDGGGEGVVITFGDITTRKSVAEELEAAKRQADLANVAKSRFLAAASHDLRQPLQTLTLLQGLLAEKVEGTDAKDLVVRLEHSLGAMSGMLNTLLDINQIEAGTVRAELVSFPVNYLLDRLRDEFTYLAQAKGLSLCVVGCGLSVHSDPRLLDQMVRNLLSNALKYTQKGKILLGCRRQNGALSIEIWDTGIGIPEAELHAIFQEYHQVDNAARERSLGLGLGLSIVQRLGNLLGHRVDVRSNIGKGSMFSVKVDVPPSGTVSGRRERPNLVDIQELQPAAHTGTILVIEDDPDIRGLLELFIRDRGHRVATAVDGPSALQLVSRGTIRPDLVLADHNLPGGLTGLQLAARLRETLHPQLPVIILTGDISTATLQGIAAQNCVQLNKPVNLADLTGAIQRLLAKPPSVVPPPVPRPEPAPRDRTEPTIFVVDDDSQLRALIRGVLEGAGRRVEDFASCEAFLAGYRPGGEACLLIDAYLPGMNGFELLRHLGETGTRLPSIMITGSNDVPTAVQAMKAGASDFIVKPIGRAELLACVEKALEHSKDASKLFAQREQAAQRVADLTPRQRQIMDMVLAGHPSKNISADLGISQRTVENHRASIMKRTGSKSLPALARLALAVSERGGDDPLV